MTKILVIGEACTDRFVYVKVERLSPEAPVPVLVPICTTENPGMSGNVVQNLMAIDENAEVTHWYQSEPLMTKTRFVEQKSNHMFVRLDEGESQLNRIQLDDEKLQQISDYDIVIVSDYAKGFLKDEDLINIAKQAKLSILDSKRLIKVQVANSYSWIKLNEHESVQNTHHIDRENVLVTLGSRGVKHRNTLYPTNSPKETIDVSGAGDTFTAAFILMYHRTGDAPSAIRYANEQAGIVVSKRGVATP